jgi:hypothetical protein
MTWLLILSGFRYERSNWRFLGSIRVPDNQLRIQNRLIAPFLWLETEKLWELSELL